MTKSSPLHDSTPLWRAVTMTCRSFVRHPCKGYALWCLAQSEWFVFLPSTFCHPNCVERRCSFCQEYFNKSHIKFGLAMLVLASDFYWNYVSLWGTHASCSGWDETCKHRTPTNMWNGTASSVLLCLRGPVITCYWVCVKATDPKIHRFRSNN